ncbi:MAG: hypothetical protein ACLUN9_19830 [Enterocloster aldenensis]
MRKRASGSRRLEMFVGLLLRLALVLIRLAELTCMKSGGLSPRQLGRLLEQIKSYEAIVMSVNSLANTLSAGRVDA